MTTLALLFAVIRDVSRNPSAKNSCQKRIWQEEDPFSDVPERARLTFAIRGDSERFFDDFVKPAEGTAKLAELKKLASSDEVTSVRAMAAAILEMRKYFEAQAEQHPDQLLHFISNKVLMIYVSTEDLEDAFRLFVILNDRGVPLRNSDILKSMNLGAVETPKDKSKYATLWEEAEAELGEEFDRFLNYLRTLLVKEKARANLLQEFEDKIYEPKERDKTSGERKPVLLQKGKATFELIDKYFAIYREILDGKKNHDNVTGFEFDNLLKVMQSGFSSTDWIPPLLRYHEKFGMDGALPFLKRLDNKFSADWIGQSTPTQRIEAMIDVIKAVEEAPTAASVLDSPAFEIDGDAFMRTLEGNVYGRKFARYLLLKLDYYFADHSNVMQFETLSIEHILPQNPSDDSQWVRDFSDTERQQLTNKVGNLVLISRRKNSAQGRLDYVKKKQKYFEDHINTFPNSLRVLNNASVWTPSELGANHKRALDRVRKGYGLTQG